MIQGHLKDGEHAVGLEKLLKPFQGKLVLAQRTLIEFLLSRQEALRNALLDRRSVYGLHGRMFRTNGGAKALDQKWGQALRFQD